MPYEWVPAQMPGVGNSRKDLPGWFGAKLEAAGCAGRTAKKQEASTGSPIWWGGDTYSGSCDEVWELPRAPMQNGLLDPCHVQEHGGVHGCRWKATSSPGRDNLTQEAGHLSL